MSTPSNPQPSGDDRNLVPVDEQNAVAFEDKLHLFWRKNGGLVLGVCAAILIGILAKGGWEWYQHKRNAEIGRTYAAASTPEQLKAFAAANAGHELAGIAHLRAADEAYDDGKAADAVASYERALEILEDGPLAARAKIGRALAKVQSGKAAEGTSELKTLADDTGQLDAVRSEAAYHLASLAAEAGNAVEAQTYIDHVTRISADPRANPWVARAMALRSTLPVGSELAPAPGAADSVQPEESASTTPIRVPGQ